MHSQAGLEGVEFGPEDAGELVAEPGEPADDGVESGMGHSQASWLDTTT